MCVFRLKLQQRTGTSQDFSNHHNEFTPRHVFNGYCRTSRFATFRYSNHERKGHHGSYNVHVMCHQPHNQIKKSHYTSIFSKSYTTAKIHFCFVT